MSVELEDRVRRALSARAAQVTPERLQPAMPPTVAVRARRSWRPSWWRSMLVVAAVVVAVVFAVHRPDGTDPRPTWIPPATSVPSGAVPSDPVPSDPVPSAPVPSGAVPSGALPSAIEPRVVPEVSVAPTGRVRPATPDSDTPYPSTPPTPDR